MEIIDGKKLRDEILAKVKSEVAALPFRPVFCDVLVGNDPASLQYVQMKQQMAEAVGIMFHQANFPASVTTLELIKEINTLNKIENMCGIIVQLPLEEHVDQQEVLDTILPKFDVDCLGKVASEKFYAGDISLGYPAALACMVLLDSLNLDNNPSTALRTRKIVVLGQGRLVGKPVAALLKFRGLEVEIVTNKTENKEAIIKQADIIISGMGQGKYITGEMIKEGAIVIDAGTSEENKPNGAIVGDVDLESVKVVASYASPVPGGVGPVTVAMLLNNVVSVAKSLKNTQGYSIGK